ncbi:MscS-Like mechanosensitive ion channel MSCL15 [Reticulomyxa filosa]|uniref:MscS-Like mechanosensitive ion channel MSCL15 n=1 Tax=Reticulomyxa filosa TaxID=46433 RepID=X6LWF8_RETFI|nr:MscS-Like mechanosensitive ion channel MSCL15 [Reticulomyxa filosa]|eukprot:ETO05711.1 MscS-Like mechanosensitive ion channel MSCL15 [Reticulomyxa filosa]
MLYYYLDHDREGLDIPAYAWFFWISSIFWFVAISRIISSMVSFLLQIFFKNNWKIHFYFLPLESSTARFVQVNLSFICFMVLVGVFTANSDINVWHLEEDYGKLTTFFRVLLCLLILEWLMFIKSMAIRFFNARIYLSKYFRLFEVDIKLSAYESWLKSLLGDKKVFTPSLTDFLVSFPSHPKAQKLYRTEHLHAFCLNVTQHDPLLVEQFRHVIVSSPADDMEGLESHSTMDRNLSHPTSHGEDNVNVNVNVNAKANASGLGLANPFGKKEKRKTRRGKKKREAEGGKRKKGTKKGNDDEDEQQQEMLEDGLLEVKTDTANDVTMTMATTSLEKKKSLDVPHPNDWMAISSSSMKPVSEHTTMKKDNDVDSLLAYKQSHNSFYRLLHTKRQRHAHPKWTTLTFHEFFAKPKHARGVAGGRKDPSKYYFTTWSRHCEVVDPLWKKIRLAATAHDVNSSQTIKDHITLWAFDSVKTKVTIADEKTLKKVSKILAAYIMPKRIEVDYHFDPIITITIIIILPPKKNQGSTHNNPSPTLLKKSARGYLIESDFVKIFGSGKRYEAHRAFRRFDSGQKGKVTYVNLHGGYSTSLQTLSMPDKLFCLFFFFFVLKGREMYVYVHCKIIYILLMFFVACFVFLLVFHYDITTAISMYASLIALVLIFGSSALSSIVNGVILIYLIQPFSVGHVIYLNNTRYTVKKMGLTSTFFETSWGTPACTCKECLIVLEVEMKHTTLAFSSQQETTNKQLEEFKKLFMIYIKHVIPLISNDNVWIIFYEFDQLGRTRVCLWIDSLLSFANGRARWNQHSEIIFGIRKILEDLKIRESNDTINISIQFI